MPPSNHYFTSEHEQAIIRYARTDSNKEREQLYIKFICPVFNEMVDKIIFTYKFTNLPNIESLKQECKIWLVTILDKFKPENGSKAFSYFSVITKNWFIHKVKKNALQTKKEVQYEEISKEQESRHFVVNNDYMQLREQKEYFDFFSREMEDWTTDEDLKPDDIKVLEAIRTLMETSDSLEIFNKKAIYLYIREITGLNTKHIVVSLKKIKIKYKNFKDSWNSENVLFEESNTGS